MSAEDRKQKVEQIEDLVSTVEGVIEKLYEVEFEDDASWQHTNAVNDQEIVKLLLRQAVVKLKIMGDRSLIS